MTYSPAGKNVEHRLGRVRCSWWTCVSSHPRGNENGSVLKRMELRKQAPSSRASFGRKAECSPAYGTQAPGEAGERMGRSGGTWPAEAVPHSSGVMPAPRGDRTGWGKGDHPVAALWATCSDGPAAEDLVDASNSRK